MINWTLKRRKDSTQLRGFCHNSKNYLQLFFNQVFKIPTSSRSYRQTFSGAYRDLFAENKLCFLSEILDSAQENIDILWVNGEKYQFSEEVIESGVFLCSTFNSLVLILKTIYNKLRLKQNLR